MLKSYRVGWWGGGPHDYCVSPSPFALDFGTLDYGTSDSGLTIIMDFIFLSDRISIANIVHLHRGPIFIYYQILSVTMKIIIVEFKPLI